MTRKRTYKVQKRKREHKENFKIQKIQKQEKEKIKHFKNKAYKNRLISLSSVSDDQKSVKKSIKSAVKNTYKIKKRKIKHKDNFKVQVQKWEKKKTK